MFARLAKPFALFGLLLAGTVLASACGPRKATGPSTQHPQTAAAAAASKSAEDWLDGARQQLAAKRWGMAARSFAQAIEQGLQPTLRQEALVGLAMARRSMGDCLGSNRALDTLLQDPQRLEAPERSRRYYEHGICAAELLDWDVSQKDLQKASEADPELSLSMRMELSARRGLALFSLDRLDEAEKTLQAGLTYYEGLDSTARERLADPYFVAMAHFYLGAIAHRRFLQISLHLPKARMAKELEDKSHLLAQLQHHYHNAIRVRHVFWVSAAGFQLGSAFAEFYDEMLQSPVPKRLSPAQRAIFYTELKRKIRPVVLKAVHVYEKNLEAAKRLGYSTPFVEDTKARLTQLQHYLVSDMATGPFAPPPLFAAKDGQQQPEQEAGPHDWHAPAFFAEPTPL